MLKTVLKQRVNIQFCILNESSATLPLSDYGGLPVDPPETGGDCSDRRLHLIEQAAERPNVGAAIDGLAFGLLGRHCEDGAEPGPALRNAFIGLGGLRQWVSLDDRFDFPLRHEIKSFVEIFGAVLLTA